MYDDPYHVFIDLVHQGYTTTQTPLGALTFAEEMWNAQTGERLDDRKIYSILIAEVNRRYTEAIYPFLQNLFCDVEAICLFNINLELVWLVEVLREYRAQTVSEAALVPGMSILLPS